MGQHKLNGGRNTHAVHAHALKILPSFVLSRVELAKELFQEESRTEEATEHFKRALVIAPSSFDGRMEFGNALYSRGRYSEALAVLKPPGMKLDKDYHLDPESPYYH